MQQLRLFNILIALVWVISASAADIGETQRLVIMHTNDTHSQIDTLPNGYGGALRRKVVIDSIRAAEPLTLLIDAGDAVQGSVYFTLFDGELEGTLMNAMGYDYAILGNHEFDRGMDVLTKNLERLDATKLCTNYTLRDTPLHSIMQHYDICQAGPLRIGLIGLSPNPVGLISAKNCEGVNYIDPIEAANATAWHLRHNEEVDMVIVVSHLGYSNAPYNCDVELAAKSTDIDIIIGGHTHTTLDPLNPESPAWLVENRYGRQVLLAQTGSRGHNVGVIDVDLNTMQPTSRLISVDARLDSRITVADLELLAPYRATADSIMAIPVALARDPLIKQDWSLMNLMADFVDSEASRLVGRPVDLSIINKGGLRCDLPQGTISKGLIMQMMPFENHIEVLELKGSDLLEALNIMAARGGDCVSHQVRAIYDPVNAECYEVTISGEPLDLDHVYTVGTIDYLSGGGDYLSSFQRGHSLAHSSRVLYDDLILYLEANYANQGRSIEADRTPRMAPQGHNNGR